MPVPHRRLRRAKLLKLGLACTLLFAALDPCTFALDQLQRRGIPAAPTTATLLPRNLPPSTPGPSRPLDRRRGGAGEEQLAPRWEASTEWVTASVTVTATSQLTTLAIATETATATAIVPPPPPAVTSTIYETTTSTQTVTITATAPGGPPARATCCVAVGHGPHGRRARRALGAQGNEGQSLVEVERRQGSMPPPTPAPVVFQARRDSSGISNVIAGLGVQRRSDGGEAPNPDCVYTTLTSTAYVTTTRTKLEMATATSTHTLTVTLNQAAPLPTSPPPDSQCESWCDASNLYNSPPPPPPPPPSHPKQVKPPKPIPDNGVCSRVVAWVVFIYGGVPRKGADFFASLIFFFNYCFFAAVAGHRLFGWGRYDKYIFSNLVPTLLACLLLVSWTANRAYTANSTPDIEHVLASHTMFIVTGPLLMESALQLFGLLSLRANPGGWIDASSIFLRLMNVTAEVLSIVAAAQLISWLHAWEDGTADCYSPILKSITTLPLVADYFLLFISLGGLVLVVLARLRNLMEFPVLIHQALLFLFLMIHAVWRLVRDTHASSVLNAGIANWRPPADLSGAPNPASQGGSFGVNADNSPNWDELRKVRDGAEAPAIFWLMGFLSLFSATLLLLAANLTAYTSATAPPLADEDCARYKLCFSEATGKMELQLVNNPGPPVLPSGEPLYELVRGDDGEWNVRPAEGPTVLPKDAYITLKPWYH